MTSWKSQEFGSSISYWGLEKGEVDSYSEMERLSAFPRKRRESLMWTLKAPLILSSCQKAEIERSLLWNVPWLSRSLLDRDP